MSEALPVSAAQPHCLNCAAVLHGPFCAQCGQEHTPGAVPVRDYFKDLVDAIFDWDSKVLRSLGPLVAKPGFLTREFLAGRRVPYFLPSRLYFLISLVFFFLVNHFDPVTTEAMGASGVDSRLAAGINEAVAGLLPPFMLGVIPVFALGLWLVYLRSGLFFSQHLAFAFHFFAFVFIAFALPVVTHSDALWNLSFLVVPVYLFLALRRVYPQPLWKVAAKSAVLYVYFWVLLLCYFVFVFLVGWMRAVL